MFNRDKIKNGNDSKKIMTLFILIMILMISTTGATYAYFAFSAVATNNITGTAATASLDFMTSDGGTNSGIPSLIAPTQATYTSGKMVPQLSLVSTTNVLQKALTGASGKDKCVDANGNVICRAYTFSIKNTSTAVAVIKGQIKFAFTSTFTNLKWKLMDSATSVTVASGNTGTLATTDFVNFDTGVSLGVGATKQYWMIFWIEETKNNQNATDLGTFYATIQFINNIDGTGITSTITS